MIRIPWETNLRTRDEKGALAHTTFRAPFIKVRIYYQNDLNKALMGPALVDSGAGGLLMPKKFADYWGIDIAKLEREKSTGAGSAFNIYKCGGFKIVLMGVAGDIEAEGAFTDSRYPPVPLLGIKTIFSKYKVTVDARGEAVELEPY